MVKSNAIYILTRCSIGDEIYMDLPQALDIEMDSKDQQVPR